MLSRPYRLIAKDRLTLEKGHVAPARWLLICCLSILFPLLEPDRLQAQSRDDLANTILAGTTLVTRVNAGDDLSPTQSFAPPEFSHSSGFYSGAFQLTLSTPQEDTSIYYTLDGSEPTDAAIRYNGPIVVESRAGDDNVLSLIRTTTPENKWNAPTGEIFKATVIRARVFGDEGGASPTVTHTYFVDPAGADRYSLPVISLVTDPDNFFDAEIGIYVPGEGYEDGDPSSANFGQSGRAWERPIHIELFGDDGTLDLAQDAGVRIHGSATRNYQTKSLRFYARSDYGPSQFNVQLFPDRPFTDYKTFILRNAGNDWDYAHLRDGLIHRLVEHLSLDLQAFRPMIVFLNGEYWGIQDLRERQDAEYLQTHYDIPTDAVDMLELPLEISEGSDEQYWAMIRYVEANGVATPETYAHLQTLLDVENFIDYNLVEIYSANTDWPHNNAENWRYQADAFDPGAPYGFDGRWRWFVSDLDYGFGRGDRIEPHQRDMLTWATSPDGNGHGEWSTFLLRALLENESFRHDFINRFADLLNTAFVPERVVAMVDEIAGSLAPEMPEHIHRYTQPASMAAWESEVALIRQFAQLRPEFQRQHIVDFFALGGTTGVGLNVSSPEAGAIRINSLLINDQTVGIAGDPYPWQGIYFQDVPVTLTAVPKIGYRFVEWEGLPDDAQAGAKSVKLLLTEDLSLTACFEADPNQMLFYLPQVPR
jgi:hypothetical protein